MEREPRARVALVPERCGRGPSSRHRRPGLLLPGLWLLLLAGPASCAPDDLSLAQHSHPVRPSDFLPERSILHSAAQVTLSETVPRSQPSISALVLSSLSATAFDTAFLSQRQQTQSTAEPSFFEANYGSVTSNEVALDDEEMDNFLPDAHWTSSRGVSPMWYITPSPPEPPQEMLEPGTTPSLPTISLPDEVLSGCQNTVQQATVYVEPSTYFGTSWSAFLTSEGIIPTPSRNSVLHPIEIHSQLSSKALPETVASVTEGAENLLFSSRISVSQPSGNGMTQQPSVPLWEVSQPLVGVLATSSDRYPNETTAWIEHPEEAIALRAHPGITTSPTDPTFSSQPSALFSTPLSSVSFATQLPGVSEDSFLSSEARGALESWHSSPVPSFTDHPYVLSPESSLRPHTGCVSCVVSSFQQELARSLTEKDMGSGDRLETLSTASVEASHVSPLSSVGTDLSELEEPQEFNTLFPSRPVFSFSSRPVGLWKASMDVSPEVDVSGIAITQVYPSHGRLSTPSSLDSTFGFSVTSDLVMSSSMIHLLSSVIPSTHFDSSFSLTANQNSPSFPAGKPSLLTSPSLVPSAQSSAFSHGAPTSSLELQSGSRLDFTSGFYSTPPLDFSTPAPSRSDELAFPSLMSSDPSTFFSQTFSTMAETFSLSNSMNLQSPQLSVLNPTSLEPSQPQSSADLLLNTVTVLPSPPERPPLSSSPSDSLEFTEVSRVSLRESHVHLTSAFSETTSAFEFSPIPHESTISTLVPSSSEPSLGIYAAGTHLTSLPTTVFHLTPILTESSPFSTLTPSNGSVRVTDHHTPVLPTPSSVIPSSTESISDPYLSASSSLVSEVSPSPPPTKPVMGSSLTSTDFPPSTSPELSTSLELSMPSASTAPGDTVDSALNSEPMSQNPQGNSVPPPQPSLGPATTSTLEATVGTPALATAKPPYVCDITVPDVYLITTVLARRAVQEYIITSIKEVLRIHFNRAVELKVYELFTDFTFLVTSGPFVYTAISVINVLINSKLVRGQTPLILSVKPSFLVPDPRFQVQTDFQLDLNSRSQVIFFWLHLLIC